MVWVRRRMLWGREERKKGKTTVPFFSGDKVLLERKVLDAPEGGWGQRAPVALGLQSHGKTKPPSIRSPQQQGLVGCRKLLQGKGPGHISFKPDPITPPTYLPT